LSIPLHSFVFTRLSRFSRPCLSFFSLLSSPLLFSSLLTRISSASNRVRFLYSYLQRILLSEETFRLQLQTVVIGSRLSSATFSGCYLLFDVVLIIFAKPLGFLALLALIVTFCCFVVFEYCLSVLLSVCLSWHGGWPEQ
jgi:hypothetical protein